MGSLFRFKQFSVSNEKSALKIGTDAVLLGASIEISDNATKALDIGTGTGVIALMLAQRSGNNLTIKAIDIDEASVEEAKLNFKNSPWAARLNAQNIRLQDYKPSENEQFDLIFSNPPYFDNSLKNPDNRKQTARHSDTLSLKDIFAWCYTYLSPIGNLWLILPYESLNSAKRIGASFGLLLYKQITIFTSEKKTAKRLILAFSKLSGDFTETSIILNKGGEQSPEYKALIKEYLLDKD